MPSSFATPTVSSASPTSSCLPLIGYTETSHTPSTVLTSTINPAFLPRASHTSLTVAPVAAPTPERANVQSGDILTCPVCSKHFTISAVNTLWRHINTDHISRHRFPPADFFALHSRLVCSVSTCRWANHSRFRHSGCQRKVSTGSRCGGDLIEASLAGISWCDEECEDADTSCFSSNISNSTPNRSYTHTDLVTIAIEATQNLHLSEEFLSLESQLVDAILDSIRRVPVTTVIHIPRSIRPLLSQVLCSVLRAATHSVWGFVQLALFPKAVLRAPPQHSPPRCRVESVYWCNNYRVRTC